MLQAGGRSRLPRFRLFREIQGRERGCQENNSRLARFWISEYIYRINPDVMKKFILPALLVAWVLLGSRPAPAQISINLDGSAPAPSAALDVHMPGKGLLPPRLALSALNLAAPVTSPATGLVVYNTASAGAAPNHVVPGYYYWNGSAWVSLPPPRGGATGEMLYWNGTGWNPLSPGLEGQKLQLQPGGIPAWSGPSVPLLTTDTVVDILQTSATVTGTVTSDGGSLIQFKGICWGTSPNPDISGQHSTEYFGTTAISGSLTGLEPATRYFARAYATNAVGTGYGHQLSFITDGNTPSQHIPIRPERGPGAVLQDGISPNNTDCSTEGTSTNLNVKTTGFSAPCIKNK